jgi:Na+-translocating ferredoxin:NAD+ oxidoreductase RnfD subunit
MVKTILFINVKIKKIHSNKKYVALTNYESSLLLLICGDFLFLRKHVQHIVSQAILVTSVKALSLALTSNTNITGKTSILKENKRDSFYT